jgi:recombinational DNA repair ATPase RecF
MKIIHLSASNVLRLKAVEIEPDGTFQIIAGRNAQGKSSVMNALWLAIAGGTASREIKRPLRDGEESAEVTLNIGDADGVKLIVTRTWNDKGDTKLIVKAADGAVYKSPQAILDQLVGSLTFDPLAFTRMKSADQRAELLDLLGLDFSDADAEEARLRALRLTTGQKADSFGTLPKLDKDAPTTEQSSAKIVERIQEATAQDRRISAHREAIERGEYQIADLAARIKALQAQMADTQQTVAAEKDALNGLAEPESIDALNDELFGLEQRNATARSNARIKADAAEQKRLQDEYTEYTHKIRGIAESKAKAIAAAKMPVDGLGFDDQGVTYNGVPFSQASSAEQIRVSLAMAMALNPTLRIIRIMDGSLLDKDSLAEIAEMAKEHDYQVWVEMVGDRQSAGEAAVILEDGSVVD